MSLRGTQPGKYRQRITLQEPVEQQDDDSGDVVITWRTVDLAGQPLDGVPAQVLTGPGRELIAAAAKRAEAAARINLRWFPGLLPTWRVLWNGAVYGITSIETDETGRLEWRLICHDGLSDGR